MFQREVAERIAAAPGSKLTADCRCWRSGAAMRALCSTSTLSAFVPPPKVKSSVLRLVPRPDPLPCDRRLLESVTQAAFGQRRKMLRQSLRSLGIDTAALLAAANLDPTARAEEIPVSGFVALARALAAARDNLA